MGQLTEIETESNSINNFKKVNNIVHTRSYNLKWMTEDWFSSLSLLIGLWFLTLKTYFEESLLNILFINRNINYSHDNYINMLFT